MFQTKAGDYYIRKGPDERFGESMKEKGGQINKGTRMDTKPPCPNFDEAQYAEMVEASAMAIWYGSKGLGGLSPPGTKNKLNRINSPGAMRNDKTHKKGKANEALCPGVIAAAAADGDALVTKFRSLNPGQIK